MRMKSTTIQFLADSLIKLRGNDQSKQKIIGRRPGEKIHEGFQYLKMKSI